MSKNHVTVTSPAPSPQAACVPVVLSPTSPVCWNQGLMSGCGLHFLCFPKQKKQEEHLAALGSSKPSAPALSGTMFCPQTHKSKFPHNGRGQCAQPPLPHPHRRAHCTAQLWLREGTGHSWVLVTAGGKEVPIITLTPGRD